MHERKGPAYSILFGRLDDGRRFMANTPGDPALLANMSTRDYLGAKGRVRHGDGVNIFVPD
jgi:acetyl-CoA C-acetyltransferase